MNESQIMPSNRSQIERILFIVFHLHENLEKTTVIYSDREYISGWLGPVLGWGLTKMGYKRAFWGVVNFFNL